MNTTEATHGYRATLRTALSVAGIVLSVVVGYNTWQQIEVVNAADAAPHTPTPHTPAPHTPVTPNSHAA